MVKALVAGLLGGLIVFVWTGISWMLLPWHANVLHAFKQEEEITKVINVQVAQSGVYMLPHQDEAKGTQEMKGPLIFSVVRLGNIPSMTVLLRNELLIQILAAFLVSAWIWRMKGVSYLGRVFYVALFGLTAGIATYLPLWNWFGFPIPYVAVSLADLLIAWFLAGFVIAWATHQPSGKH
jgi:hypothetical protein